MGSFKGQLKGTWIPGTRDFLLDGDLYFHSNRYMCSANGNKDGTVTYMWKAPKGSLMDGASIPRVFWAIIGSPYIGDYRRAAAIHDYHCTIRREPSRVVHELFSEMIKAEGVSGLRYYAMSRAVKWFGPRW